MNALRTEKDVHLCQPWRVRALELPPDVDGLNVVRCDASVVEGRAHEVARVLSNLDVPRPEDVADAVDLVKGVDKVQELSLGLDL